MRTPRPKPDAPTTGRGSVHADELLDLRTFGSRLGLGNRILRDLQKEGLYVVTLGRRKYTTGQWALDFCEAVRKREQAAGQQGGNAHD